MPALSNRKCCLLGVQEVADQTHVGRANCDARNVMLLDQTALPANREISLAMAMVTGRNG